MLPGAKPVGRRLRQGMRLIVYRAKPLAIVVHGDLAVLAPDVDARGPNDPVDRELAEFFCVPLEQVAERRADLAADYEAWRLPEVTGCARTVQFCSGASRTRTGDLLGCDTGMRSPVDGAVSALTAGSRGGVASPTKPGSPWITGD
jgi:hypothetical protein